jgi:hypothetical protein
MSNKTKQKFEAMRPGECLSFQLSEASATFADEQFLEGGDLPSSNFDRFIREHEASHYISICGDYLVVTRKRTAA